MKRAGGGGRKASEGSTLHRGRVGGRGGRESLILNGWTRMFEANWEAIAEDKELGRVALRVLLLCAVNVSGRDNRVGLRQREMAMQLGVTAQAVSKAMQTLVRKGLIFQEGQVYRINSRLVAKQSSLIELVELRKEEAGLLLRSEEDA